MQERMIDLSGPVHVVDNGGDGPAMVLVHGLGGASINWMAVGPALAERARVFAIDLIGCGRTPSAGRAATVENDVDLLDRFIGEVAGGPAIVVGNSRGGLVSMLEAASNRSSVAGLVLVDPAMPQWPDVVDPMVGMLFATYAVPGAGEQFLRMWQDAIGPA